MGRKGGISLHLLFWARGNSLHWSATWIGYVEKHHWENWIFGIHHPRANWVHILKMSIYQWLLNGVETGVKWPCGLILILTLSHPIILIFDVSLLQWSSLPECRPSLDRLSSEAGGSSSSDVGHLSWPVSRYQSESFHFSFCFGLSFVICFQLWKWLKSHISHNPDHYIFFLLYIRFFLRSN